MSELHKFIFDGLPVRGALVRLTDTWQELLQRRSASGQGSGYPQPVVHMLGQMTAAATLLRSSIKFDGSLILQVAGDGPVPVAVAEVDAQLRLRAMATLSAPIEEDTTLVQLVNAAGRGRCAITLDPRGLGPGRKAWQGVVPLADASGQPLTSVAQMITGYMRQSEQLETALVLAADTRAACGLMVQRMPGQQGSDADAHTRLGTLAQSLGAQELLELDAATILRRLFWDEPLQLLDIARPAFHCTCDRQRVAAMLQGLGEAEVMAILREQERVEVNCEFCGAQQRFDAVDVAALFSAGQPQVASPAAIQ
ncbi:MAG: Hsp33 family molecular chaperone HslO [Ottowia sp.]|nr:Hsp33 family molecular chaperone HslO [Ottowia sp.]